MSNDSKKQGLYETLFRSIKDQFGINVDEPEDPVKAFLESFQRGECEPNLVDIILWYHQSENFEGFATRYPEDLRKFWWQMCEQAEQKRASENLDDLGQG